MNAQQNVIQFSPRCHQARHRPLIVPLMAHGWLSDCLFMFNDVVDDEDRGNATRSALVVPKGR